MVDKENLGENIPQNDLTDNATKGVENISAAEANDTAGFTGAYDDFNYLLGEDGFSLGGDEEKTEEEKPQKYKPNKGKKAKKKMAKGIKTAIWIVSILAVSVLLAATIILAAVEFLGIGPNKGDIVTIVINKGMTTDDIATELKEKGVINSEIGFKLYTKISGNDGTYTPGSRTFKDELGYSDIAKLLQKPGMTNPTVKVTIPEQADIDDIMSILEEKGVCKKTDFRKAVKEGTYDFEFLKGIPIDKVYYRFEGYLFPDTYEFYASGDEENPNNYTSLQCAEIAIRKMLKNTDDKLATLKEGIDKSEYSLHEIMTLASVIELEASASPNDMPSVAAVFYNRLEGKNWQGPRMLQSDPTMKYPYGEGQYNTYKIEGLPPGPLCAPSLAAIKAAVYPTENFSATYFVTDSEMKFYFNNSLSGHNQTIAKLKREGKWFVDPDL